MADRIALFQFAFVSTDGFASAIHDMADAEELVLDISVDSFEDTSGGAGTLTLAVEHASDGSNWITLENMTYTAAGREVKSYSSGLLEMFRVVLAPDPLPFDAAGGVLATVTVSALLRGVPVETRGAA